MNKETQHAFCNCVPYSNIPQHIGGRGRTREPDGSFRKNRAAQNRAQPLQIKTKAAHVPHGPYIYSMYIARFRTKKRSPGGGRDGMDSALIC